MINKFFSNITINYRLQNAVLYFGRSGLLSKEFFTITLSPHCKIDFYIPLNDTEITIITAMAVKCSLFVLL